MSPEKIIFTLQHQGIKLETKLRFKAETPLTLEQTQILQNHKDLLLCHLIKRDSIPRLPFKLERLVSAATNNQLNFYARDIPDLNSFVIAWACAYLVGDQQEAINRLNQILELREQAVNK